ncbi:MAG: peptidase domain-containing ABC transporter [Betaproteobacteria bacterium]|nr:peptidase domain-containing ABC transporter [Betaproteobacteria bacterium]
MDLRHRIDLGWSRRVPIVMQSEAAECGLACLAMVSAGLGRHEDLADLRRRFGVSLKGARLSQLVAIANPLGLAPRAVRLEPDELRLLRTPCILHWDMNHFVVLVRATGNDLVIHDPAAGRRRLSLKEASPHLTGVALELTPTADFEPRRAPPPIGLVKILGHIVGLRRALAQVLALALAIEVFAVISPFFLQWVVDHALVTADRDLLLTLVIGFSLLLLMRVTVAAMRGWMLMALSASLRVQGRANLFTHLVRLPAVFFETRHLGDIMSRFGSLETIQQALTTDAVEAVLDGLMAAITLVIMFVFSAVLAGIVVTAALLYGMLRWATYAPLRQASMETIVWAARRDSHFLETLRGIRTIKLLGGQGERRAHWLNLLVETVNHDLAASRLRLLFRTANALLTGALAILVVWLGAQRVLDNVFSVGILLAFIAYKDQFIQRVAALIDKAVDLRVLRLHAERLADIALTAPERDTRPAGAHAAPLRPVVEARELRFRYGEHEPWVLDGVSLRIEAGESVAIAGASGCGKTTLLKLLSGLLTPDAGEILVGGQPLARIGNERYRAMIGVVMQDDQLFAGSLADNISFFAATPDPARIERCARMAAVHDDIEAMPMGYQTLIGDMGAALSGGQKQRVLIARALYRRPRILLLDEATSHLDVGLEKAVNNAIRATSMTRIIIAHRPETIRSADRVIVLDRGRVAKDLRIARGPAAASPAPARASE